MMMTGLESRKTLSIIAAVNSVWAATSDKDKHEARLSLLVAEGKPLGAFSADDREESRQEYNSMLRSRQQRQLLKDFRAYRF